jgi:hypothetical protein
MPAPPSSNSSVIEPAKPISPKTADDINDMFKELDVEPEKKEAPKPKEKEDKEEIEEEKDDDLELIEPEEEEEKLNLEEQGEDLNIDAPPRKKEILKEYPELFKKFPFLEKMLYRDRQYSELFGSFDDAREIAEKSEAFNQFENQLLSGNTEQILREVKETDDKAFKTIVDDYLVTLHKVDKDAYLHVTGNLNKRLIAEMIAEANDSNNEDLKQAALLVNQFVFGTSKYTPPTRLVEKKDDSAKDEIERERLSFVRERFETSRDDLQSQVDNTLRATISDYIDPKGRMTSYVKKNAVADAMRILSESIASDPSVSKNLDNLWRASFAAKFSKDTLGKIKSFYLSKAKGNLKNAILKARAEALKDLAPQHNQRETDDEEIETETNSRRQPRNIPAGRPRQERGKPDGPRKGESVTDFFMRD